MSMPDDDAGRKNVEALATCNISPFTRRFSRLLLPAGTLASTRWYLNRRLSVRPAIQRLPSGSSQTNLDCAFRTALKRWGFEIETASSNLQKEGV